MNGLIIFSFTLLVAASAAPSGFLDGSVVVRPVGILANNRLGWGLGNEAILGAPLAKTIVTGSTLGLGLANGIVGVGGASAITNRGGLNRASVHGATISGLGTASAVVAGPSGKIIADGLWGPTANIELLKQNYW